MAVDGQLIYRREKNLLVCAHRTDVDEPETQAIERALRELREAYPEGSAVFHLGGGANARQRAAFGRIGFMGLLVGNADLVPGTHLGTAHLHETDGLRGAAMRRVYRWFERPDGDFTKAGNHVVRTVDEAATWLCDRLASGPLSWTRDEVRRVIAAFVASDPLRERGGASRPAA